MASNQDDRKHQGGSAQNNPGNFANDREKASEAGRKGGQASGGNFANDPERAAEAGHKGARCLAVTSRTIGNGPPRPAGSVGSTAMAVVVGATMTTADQC